MQQVVTEASIDALPTGTKYVVELGRQDYEFDQTAAPIDFERVVIRSPGDDGVPAVEWLSEEGQIGTAVITDRRSFTIRAVTPDGDVRPNALSCYVCHVTCTTETPPVCGVYRCGYEPCGAIGTGSLQ
jgi:hypothetical protein